MRLLRPSPEDADVSDILQPEDLERTLKARNAAARAIVLCTSVVGVSEVLGNIGIGTLVCSLVAVWKMPTLVMTNEQLLAHGNAITQFYTPTESAAAVDNQEAPGL